MKYSQLPPHLQELAKANCIAEENEAYFNDCVSEDDEISEMFIFRDSKEGHDFWHNVSKGYFNQKVTK